MADTVRGDFIEERCSDCGKMGCVAKHLGPLVPSGEIGTFCEWCLADRNKGWKSNDILKPIGWRMKGVYTKLAFDVLKESIKVEGAMDFLPPNKTFMSYDPDEGSWWMNESFFGEFPSGWYLVFHGYQPTPYSRYFALWVEGPFSDFKEIDARKHIERYGVQSNVLFTEYDEKIIVYVNHKFGRRFRGLIESGIFDGPRIDQFRSAAKAIAARRGD